MGKIKQEQEASPAGSRRTELELGRMYIDFSDRMITLSTARQSLGYASCLEHLDV